MAGTGLWSYGKGPKGSVQAGSLAMGCEETQRAG